MRFVLVLLTLTSVAFTTSRPPACSGEPYRQFDFWIGSWNVFNPDDRLVGTNEITTAEEGCVLIERWDGAQGSTGMSINYVDPRSGSWRQQWVAAAGYLVELEGGLVDGSMVLEGSLIGKEGTDQPMRGTWTPLDDGTVRQHFEVKDSTGAWTTWFDGSYRRADGE